MIKPTPPAIEAADKVAEAQHDGYQLTDKDIQQLALTDEEYKPLTWEDLKAIIEENRLEDLKRVPSDLKRYISWSHKTRKEYGTIQAFILKERLGWTDLEAENPTPFASEADTKILVNDWPYGNAPGISLANSKSVRKFWYPQGLSCAKISGCLWDVHLVAWTKASIPTIQEPDPEAGDITSESRKLINEFVQHTFVQHLGAENVLWFKNWASIQSVRSVEHIHVLVRGATDEFLVSVLGLEANGEMKGIGELEREREEGKDAQDIE